MGTGAGDHGRYANIIKIIIIDVVILMSCLLMDGSASASASSSSLRVGFYNQSCPNAEAIVRGVVKEAGIANEKLLAILLRLHYHDCFVQGCDGSILIDNGESTDEKNGLGHLGVRGFDIIEKAKGELERVCPNTVSCSDIVAMAARDAVALSQGPGPTYQVETGRRDGSVSNVNSAQQMPDVHDSIQTLKAKFAAAGLTSQDLVILSAGAHTIGSASCFFMLERLYDFPGTGGGSDPSISPSLLPELQSTCPKNGNVSVRLGMDRVSQLVFDKQILINIRSGMAVLQSDAALYKDQDTKRVIDSYFGPRSPSFNQDFAASMVKMGRIGVLTGSQGEIRRVCKSFN